MEEKKRKGLKRSIEEAGEAKGGEGAEGVRKIRFPTFSSKFVTGHI